MRLLSLLLLLFSFSSTLQAQRWYERPFPLPGDTAADHVFKQVYQLPDGITHTVKLSDYRGKIVLLDFWATWCNSCLNGFPKLDSLQSLYADDLQVLLVNSYVNTKDSAAKTRTFLHQWMARKKRPLSLHVVLEDRDALLRYPHLFLPHYVWIGRDGIILAISSRKEVTEANLRRAIEGLPLALPVKDDRARIDPYRQVNPVSNSTHSIPPNQRL